MKTKKMLALAILFSITNLFGQGFYTSSFGKIYSDYDKLMYFSSPSPRKSIIKDRFLNNPEFRYECDVRKVNKLSISKLNKVKYHTWGGTYGKLMSKSAWRINVDFTTNSNTTVNLFYDIYIFKDPRPRKGTKYKNLGTTYEKGYFTQLILDKNSPGYNTYINNLTGNIYKLIKADRFYPNDNNKEIGFVDIQGKRIFDWKFYYENGQLKAFGKYKNDKEEDDWKYYYDNGQLKEIGKYNSGNKIGKWKLYYDNGQIHSIGRYKDGNGVGEWKFYHRNGQLKEIGTAENDEKIGIWKVYFDNGDIRIKINQEAGIYEYYYKNGNIQSIGKKEYSLKEGKWKYYYKNGDLRLVQRFRNGEVYEQVDQYLEDGTQLLKDGNGEYRIYENGILVMKSEHENGSRSGVTTWYYSNGQVEQSAVYKYDEDSKPYGLRWEVLSSYHKDGMPREKGTLKNGNGTWVDYDKNGYKAGENVFENGIKVK